MLGVVRVGEKSEFYCLLPRHVSYVVNLTGGPAGEQDSWVEPVGAEPEE